MMVVRLPYGRGAGKRNKIKLFTVNMEICHHYLLTQPFAQKHSGRLNSSSCENINPPMVLPEGKVHETWCAPNESKYFPVANCRNAAITHFLPHASICLRSRSVLSASERSLPAGCMKISFAAKRQTENDELLLLFLSIFPCLLVAFEMVGKHTMPQLH